MHQVKLFKGVESELSGLENEVNDWLRSSGARVVNIFGNIAPQTTRADAAAQPRAFPPSDLFIAVVHETSG